MHLKDVELVSVVVRDIDWMANALSSCFIVCTNKMMSIDI